MKKLLFILTLLVSVFFVTAGVYAETGYEEKDGYTTLTVIEENIDSFGASKLATPKNLKWNADGQNGSIQWNAVAGCEGEYYIQVFRDGVSVFATNWSGLYDDDGDGVVGTDVVFTGAFSKGGNFTFSVKALGDGKKYSDSATATSGVYKFTLPSKRLSAPAIRRWDDEGYLIHTAVKNAGGYMYKIYDQDKEWIGDISYSSGETITDLSDVEEYLAEELINYCNEDEYIEAFYITVTALTYDIEAYQNSAESGFSQRINVSDVGEETSKDLDDLLDDAFEGKISAEQAVSDFKNGLEEEGVSNLELAMNMQQDPDLVNQLAQLESLLSMENGVGVGFQDKSDSGYLSTKGIALDDISVVGALLNSQGGNDVVLTFDEPAPSYSEDKLFYKNCVGVEISMEGVNNPQNLDVPVQIKIPVPNGVVPDRLVILHYHVDGSSEEIRPEIITEYGTTYAKFLLTSFSTFVFCNEDEATINVKVNSEDEVQLSGGLAGSFITAALYDKDGSMKTAKMLTPEEDMNITFPGAVSTDYVKLIWLDGKTSLAPVCESEIVVIK